MNGKPQLEIGRRSFLGGALAAVGTLAAGQHKAGAADPAPALKPGRNHRVYHFKIGEFDAWSISDGHMLFSRTR